ncbi:cold-shock protein [Paenibacillus hamazuiensis]|uniref:cold-shock protein n=1 Tax=Paenibacillus hamazuiensis TaxID=2936508 RepID=UPI00200DC905|nr:cold-shock protein [Paenibacillus hamazuiensis]
MYHKKSLEEVPIENISIWSCENEACKGWMRDNFAFESAPICVHCNSPMVKSMKMLPQLNNPNKDMKSLKKGVQI